MDPIVITQFQTILAHGSLVINSLWGFYKTEEAQDFVQFSKEASDLLVQGKLEWEHVEIVFDAYYEMLMTAHVLMQNSRNN